MLVTSGWPIEIIRFHFKNKVNDIVIGHGSKDHSAAIVGFGSKEYVEGSNVSEVYVYTNPEGDNPIWKLRAVFSTDQSHFVDVMFVSNQISIRIDLDGTIVNPI